LNWILFVPLLCFSAIAKLLSWTGLRDSCTVNIASFVVSSNFLEKVTVKRILLIQLLTEYLCYQIRSEILQKLSN
jgi:hypothetical protein